MKAEGMQEKEKDEQETREDVTIPQMVEDVRVGRMPRRRLITALSALGISAVGVGAVVAATGFQQNSKAVPMLIKMTIPSVIFSSITITLSTSREVIRRHCT